MHDFQTWLIEQRRKLATIYATDPTGGEYGAMAAGIIAQEASNRAAEHRLPELMQVWPDVADVADVDRYLVECLKAVPPPTYLTKDELAKVLRISTRSVERRIYQGSLPQPRKDGRRVVWSVKELRDYGLDI